MVRDKILYIIPYQHLLLFIQNLMTHARVYLSFDVSVAGIAENTLCNF